MTQEQIIALIICSVVLVAGIIILMVLFKKKPTKVTTQLDVHKLLESLGGLSNIESTGLENKRLKVKLMNPKLMSPTILKSMDITGMLSGKEVKLLIKENPVDVKNQLDTLRNEVKR